MSTVTATEQEIHHEVGEQSLASLTGAPQDIDQLRLQKIREYLAEALSKRDALEANLGAAASDLMWMSFRLKGAIEAALDKESNSLELFEKLMPAIDKYLRLTRQIDRFAKLERQLEAARESAFPRKAR